MKVEFHCTNGHVEVREGRRFETIVDDYCVDYNVGIEDPQWIATTVDHLVAQGLTIKIIP